MVGDVFFSLRFSFNIFFGVRLKHDGRPKMQIPITVLHMT